MAIIVLEAFHFLQMALDQFVTTAKTLSNQRSLSELCDFLNKQVGVRLEIAWVGMSWYSM